MVGVISDNPPRGLRGMSELMSGGGGRVLLVHGDAESSRRLEQTLAREGFLLDLMSAASAAEALELIGTTRLDLVISARTLPDADGLELIRRIHPIESAPPVWIVDDEAADAEDAALHAMQAGAADYLTLDPPTLAKLPRLVERAAADARARRSSTGTGHAACCRDLASISHDLRSPLAGLVALIDMLGTEADGPLSPAQRQRVVRIRAAADRLTGVVEGIADLARVEAGGLTLSRGPFDLEEVTRAVRRSVEPLLSSRAVVLQIVQPADLPPLLGDSLRIHQMITALVIGMLRQLEGTTLELQAAGHGSTVELTLREASRGIPVEALPPSFTRMENADGGPAPSESPAPMGGISFSLARGLALLQGCSLTVGRDAEGGLLASFVLPSASPDAMPRSDHAQDLRSSPDPGRS